MSAPDDFCMGTSVNGLARLADLGIPWPDTWPFSEGVRNQKGNGAVSTHGYPSQLWVWETFSIETLYRMSRLLADATSAELYMRTRKDRRPNPNWTTYKAFLVFPDLSGADGAPVGHQTDVYTNAGFRWQHMVAQ